MYATIPVPKPDLPSPLPTQQQDLMNLFYGHWQGLEQQVREHNTAASENDWRRSPTQKEVSAVFPPKIVAAVILGNMNYQVGNGGVSQWSGNGYSEWVDTLIDLYGGAATIGIPNAAAVASILTDFRQRWADDQAPREMLHDIDGDGNEIEYEDDSFDSFEDLTNRYYKIEGTEALMQAILDRFDEIAGIGLMARRKAA